MPVTKYPKTMATAFADGKVNSDILTGAINDNANIAKTVDHIDTDGTTCDIYMSDTLLTAEETELTNTCTAHSGGSGVFNEEKYEVTEESQGKISAIKYYFTDNGDGTYADLVRERLFTYSGNKLTKEEVKLYFSDGVLASHDTWEYYDTGSGGKVKKPV